MQFEQNFLAKKFWVLDNQILFDSSPMDKWIQKFSLILKCQTT